MKKKIATILIALATAIFMTGCTDGLIPPGGEATAPPTVTTPVTPVEPDPVKPEPVEPVDPVVPPVDPGDLAENDCTVTLYYDGKVFNPDDDDVKAQWTKVNTLGEVVGIPVTAKFDSNGVAVAKDLDGNYKVTLTKVPTGYTYNPNLDVYYANSRNKKHISIELVKLNVSKNSGADYYTSRIVIENIKEGYNVYRITIRNSSQKVFFSFTPSKNGVYTLESWANVTDNEINPSLYIYNGNAAYINVDYPADKIYDGGICASYTKNFVYSIKMEQSMVRNTVPFAVLATSSKSYPISFDFCLEYRGPYAGETFEEVLPQEFMPIMADADYNKKLAELQKTGDQAKIDEFIATYKRYSESSAEVSAKKRAVQDIIYANGITYHDFPVSGSDMLSDKNIKLNPEDGYYHFYENGVYGSVICASFEQNTRCMVPNPDYGTGLNNTSIPRKLNGKDYTNFIANYYATYAVGGFYPVTEELKEYLQAYAKSQAWFFDGKGWLEDVSSGGPGISSTEKAQWLACCVYFN